MSLPKGLLIQWANKQFKLLPLLEQVGLHDPCVGQLCFCPFHDDKSGGKRSGKIFKDAFHCYSEVKQYRPYDILRHLDFSDVEIERELRVNGNLPDEIAYGYSDEERVDLRSPFMFHRSSFIMGKAEFSEYANFICQSFVNSLLQNRK